MPASCDDTTCVLVETKVSRADESFCSQPPLLLLSCRIARILIVDCESLQFSVCCSGMFVPFANEQLTILRNGPVHLLVDDVNLLADILN